MNDFLKLLLGSQQAKAQMDDSMGKPEIRKPETFSSELVDDGGFTQNVLMKGIPGIENPTPSFTGIDNTAWTPNGPVKPAIPVRPDDLPPSPLDPSTQALMPAAKPLPMPKAPVVPAPVATEKPSAKPTVTAPKEEPKVEETKTEEAQAPKEQSALEKLLEAYNTPQRDTELEEAQAKRNDIMRQLAMLRGFEQIGAGLGGFASKKDFLEDQMGLAGMPVKDIEQRREQERKMRAEKAEGLKLGMDVERFKQDSESKGIDLQKAKLQLKDAQANNDPNSDISKATREAIIQRFKLAKANVNVPQGLSATQLKGMFPMGDIVDDLLKQQTAKELAAERKSQKEERDKASKDAKIQQLTTHISDKIKQVDEKVGYNKALSDYELLKDRMASGKFDSITDLTATYALMKALDPGSVVRESEFDNLVKTQGGFESIKRTPERFFKGNIYSPEFRKKLLDQFGGVVDARRKQMAKVLEPDLKRAKDLGIDESYILAPSTSKSLTDSGKSVIKKEYSKSRNQTRVTYSDGSQEIVDGQK